MPQILIPHFVLFGVPIFTTIRGARDAGFDGVEIHLAGQSQAGALERRMAARELGLATHLHQGWSVEENPTHWYNRVLGAMGRLPRKGYWLSEHIPGVPDPVVIYAERYREAVSHPNWWLQTCRSPGVSMQFVDFTAAVQRGRLPVVFDVQHYLELRLGVMGVGDINLTPALIGYLLEQGWQLLGPLVREIHLDDCDPRLGHTNGRNMPLGTGVVPLRDFCRMVRESGWDGVVTPEVSPIHLRGQRRRYAELRRQVAELFTH